MRIDGICSYFFVQVSKDFKHKRSIHDHSSDDIEDMVRDKTDVLVNEAHLHENQRKHDGKKPPRGIFRKVSGTHTLKLLCGRCKEGRI